MTRLSYGRILGAALTQQGNELEQLNIGVWAYYSTYSKKFCLTLAESDMSHEGWVHVKDCVIEAELPPHSILAPQAAKNLEKKKSEIRADSQEKLQKVDDEIQALLAIENKEQEDE